MRRLQSCLVGVLLLLGSGETYQIAVNEQSDGATTPSRTLRPVVRGTQYALSSTGFPTTKRPALLPGQSQLTVGKKTWLCKLPKLPPILVPPPEAQIGPLAVSNPLARLRRIGMSTFQSVIRCAMRPAD